MQFTITRDAILKPLQLAAGVVERRHTLPVLANVLLTLKDDLLEITGTDLEVELIGRVRVNSGSRPGEITVPGRKLLDICKSLPDDAVLDFLLEDGKFVIKAGRSRFTLATLPATDFPVTVDEPGTFEQKRVEVVDRLLCVCHGAAGCSLLFKWNAVRTRPVLV